MKKIKNALVILAGGIGTRFGKKLPKQFIEINGENLIQFFLRRIDTTNFNIIVIVHKKSYSKYINKIKINFPSNQFLFVNAGKNRQQSSFNGLIKLKQYQPENVLIHDAARPFCSNKLILKIIKNLEKKQSAIPYTVYYDNMHILVDPGLDLRNCKLRVCANRRLAAVMPPNKHRS